MTQTEADTGGSALGRRFLELYPREAATSLEAIDPESAATEVAHADPGKSAAVWRHLSVDTGAAMLPHLPEDYRLRLLALLEPPRSARFLAALSPEAREALMTGLEKGVAREVRNLLTYPPEAAGRWMDPRAPAMHPDDTVGEALARVRRHPAVGSGLFLVDEEGRLTGYVLLRALAIADPEQQLAELARPADGAVSELAPREEVVAQLERYRVSSLPVVDHAGVLVGVLHQSSLVAAVQEDASADMAAMVGASREERVLSGVGFSVSRRLPWLVINLATAFLAAAVVGLFEGTIARFTALAVLLPVVAGQSGNAGAQALAITMRGLSLREISPRHSVRVALKELWVGLVNGAVVALICAGGVWLWSASWGLALVIALAMVLAMVAAGIAGALIPVAFTRLGMDPAQSSTIFLTTITDVVGFAAFLGIATALAGIL